MTPFILPPERFNKIPVANLDPATSIVVAVEDPDTKQVKGYWVAQTFVHIEPIWLDPSVGGITGLKMFALLLTLLNQAGVQNYYANADRQEISDYLSKLGMKLLPYLTYAGKVPPIPASQEPTECLQQSLSQP